MIGIVAAAALTAFTAPPPVPAEVTARDIGRLSFYAGVCSSIGWESSQERAIAAAEAWEQAHPGTDETENVAQIELGVADARAEVAAQVATFRSDRNSTAFAEALKTRCDGAARDFPQLINRTAETEATFQAAIAQIARDLGGR